MSYSRLDAGIFFPSAIGDQYLLSCSPGGQWWPPEPLSPLQLLLLQPQPFPLEISVAFLKPLGLFEIAFFGEDVSWLVFWPVAALRQKEYSVPEQHGQEEFQVQEQKRVQEQKQAQSSFFFPELELLVADLDPRRPQQYLFSFVEPACVEVSQLQNHQKNRFPEAARSQPFSLSQDAFEHERALDSLRQQALSSGQAHQESGHRRPPHLQQPSFSSHLQLHLLDHPLSFCQKFSLQPCTHPPPSELYFCENTFTESVH